jgi:hypothetical protein
MGKAREAVSTMTSIKTDALELLRSPFFFSRLLKDIHRSGLVGEERNALVSFVAATSRLLPQPISMLVKGSSSAGKNWMVDRVLDFLPSGEVHKFSASSAKSWNYQENNLAHKVVFLEERNEASGPVHPLRLLISEGKLISNVTRQGRFSGVREFVTKGPIAAISTTTQNRIEIDDETRHVSIWVDESQEQTGRIVGGDVERELSENSNLITVDLKRWHMVQRLLKRRAQFPIQFSKWLRQVGDSVDRSRIWTRRYFPTYLRAIKTVALIRSFHWSKAQLLQKNRISVRFSDVAITTRMFGPVLAESLGRADDSNLEVRERITHLSDDLDGEGVSASDLSHDMKISLHRAYGFLRDAYKSGTIRRANSPSEANRKLYLPSPLQSFLPEPEELFRRLVDGPDYVKFVDPLSGKWTTYRRKRSGKED